MGNEMLRQGVALEKAYVCENCGAKQTKLDRFVRCSMPGCKDYRCLDCIQSVEVTAYDITAVEDVVNNGSAAAVLRVCERHVDQMVDLIARSLTHDRILRAIRATARAAANGKEEAADAGGA